MVNHKEHRFEAPQQTRKLPLQFVDSHQHFLDTVHNDFQSFVASLLPSKTVYGPKQYQKDVIEPLLAEDCEFVGSVHVECMPDDSVAEAKWAAGSSPHVCAVVASCDLSSLSSSSSSSSSSSAAAAAAASDNKNNNNNMNKAEAILQQLQAVPKVKGIRWILDHVGEDYTPTNATHVATTRHAPGRGDYLKCRSNNNNNNNDNFVFDLSLLQKYNYSFDLQCAPEQLEAAFQMCVQTPDVAVAIDHLGKPRVRRRQRQQQQEHDDDDDQDDNFDLKIWTRGMQQMAQLPNTYCKISMLGYIYPGWYGSVSKRLLIKNLVCQVIQWFGPKRCMVALNWWKDAAMSDSDGWSDQGPSPVQLLSILQEWFVQEGLSEEDRYELFCGTARRFYRF